MQGLPRVGLLVAFGWPCSQGRKPKKKVDGRLAVASGVSSEQNKMERKTPGCRGTWMKETERMKDEPVTAWDTFGKKIRMNFIRTGAYKDL